MYKYIHKCNGLKSNVSSWVASTCFHVPMGPWAYGPMGPWAHGPMGPWAMLYFST